MQNRTMKKILFGVLAFIGVVTFSGCLKDSNDDTQQGCTYDPCSIKAPAAEIQAVQKYLTDSSLTATQHCSGLFYKIDSEGTGNSPNACSYVEIKYKGKLANGTVFQQTDAGSTYKTYLSNLITGWINGLPYLKTGGKITLYIPPTLGYGATERKDAAGNVVIPANSITIFEIEMVAFQ